MFRPSTYRAYALASTLLLLQGCTLAYSGRAIDATVVDADTHQPLPDVDVVAEWVVGTGLIEGGTQQVKMMETLTDTAGHFHFPPWGPVLRSQAHVTDDRGAPELYLFKSGYELHGLHNERDSSGLFIMVYRSDWSGKTIPLRKFDGPPERYANLLHLVQGVHWSRCEWKEIPRMIVAVSKEQERLRTEGSLKNEEPWLEALEGRGQSECGSVGEFFREYLK